MKLLLTLLATMITAACNAAIKIEVKNPSLFDRKSETIEIPWDKILQKLPQATKDNVVVLYQKTQIPSQVTAQSLIFQVDIQSLSKQKYIIQCAEREPYKAKTYARLVKERKDDWAWENDKMAWRVYGPALQATGEISNGIDVWCKRTDDLVINKWYKANDYHNDKGEGMDGYKVGRTLGAGALAPTLGDTLCLGLNFTKAELIDSGAIRTTVRLSYAPYKVGADTLIEERIISLDAASRFNRVKSTFWGISNGSMQAVAGFPLRSSSVVVGMSGALTASQEADSQQGIIFLSLVMQSATQIDTIQNHIVGHTTIENGKPTSYLIGAAWSRADVPSQREWNEIVRQQIAIENEPLLVVIRN